MEFWGKFFFKYYRIENLLLFYEVGNFFLKVALKEFTEKNWHTTNNSYNNNCMRYSHRIHIIVGLKKWHIINEVDLILSKTQPTLKYILSGRVISINPCNNKGFFPVYYEIGKFVHINNWKWQFHNLFKAWLT